MSVCRFQEFQQGTTKHKKYLLVSSPSRIPLCTLLLALPLSLSLSLCGLSSPMHSHRQRSTPQHRTYHHEQGANCLGVWCVYVALPALARVCPSVRRPCLNAKKPQLSFSPICSQSVSHHDRRDTSMSTHTCITIPSRSHPATESPTQTANRTADTCTRTHAESRTRIILSRYATPLDLHRSGRAVCCHCLHAQTITFPQASSEFAFCSRVAMHWMPLAFPVARPKENDTHRKQREHP